MAFVNNGGSDGTDPPDPRVHDDDERKAVHVILCAASVAGWRLFCQTHGVSLTGMLDALGHSAAALVNEDEMAALGHTVMAALADARRIDVNRRLRPK